MKKLVLVLLTVLFTTMSFAQKKELRDISKAIKKGSMQEAKELITALEGSISGADADQQAEFYLYKGQVYAKTAGSNDEQMVVAATAFKKVIEIENKSGDKQYTSQAEEDIENLRITLVNAAVKDQNSERYEQAAKKLYASYTMSPKDTSDLYYAASNLLNAKKYDAALEYYNKLIDLGYQGNNMAFTAVNKETGQEKEFPNQLERDKAVLEGGYIKPGTKVIGSKRFEIYRMAAVLYVQKDDMENANQILKRAKTENPEKTLELLKIEADIALRSNDMKKYGELMKEVIKSDPNNPELFFNLGVSAADVGQTEEAIQYYKKALELDPDYTKASLNLAVAILSQETAIVEEMNGLGMSAADNKRYDELKAKREQVYREAVPYLEKALTDQPNNAQVIQTLANIYSQIGESDKAAEMKARLN